MGGSTGDWQDPFMRFALAAVPSGPHAHRALDVPVTVLIRPSRGIPGEHSYKTDRSALRDMLKRHTELSGVIIDGFMTQLKSGVSARLSAVELNDHTLREIGYFVD